MPTGAVISRYGAEDFETASVRSAAPSYISDAPSYHSYSAAAPAYAPRDESSSASHTPTCLQGGTDRPRQVGLPPLPPAAPQGTLSVHNHRLPTWSASNAPAARHYRNVAERRTSSAKYGADLSEAPRKGTFADPPREGRGRRGSSSPEVRPLEDPYLVGEVAAAEARRERLLRETGEDVLVQEDRQWDWFLDQMKDWDERERSWTRFRREVDKRQRKNLLHRINGRLSFLG